MNFLVKIIVSMIVAVIIFSLSSVIFNALDVEPYVYSPYVSWIILLIALFLFLPTKMTSIFDNNNVL